MTADEWEGIRKYIEAVWRRELTDITSAAWGATLQNHAVEDVMGGVAVLAKSPDMKFLPSLAEIIEATREQYDLRQSRQRQLPEPEGIPLRKWLEDGCPGLDNYFPNLATPEQRRAWALRYLPVAPTVEGPWD